MIPFSTDAPLYHKPVVTCILIAINIVMFFLFCHNAERSQGQFVLVDDQGNHLSLEELKKSNPAEAAQLEELIKQETVSTGPSSFETLSVEFGKVRPWQWLTTNFMHADLEHLLGNMIFLWAFGLVVEGKVGHLVFLAIYVGIGALYGMAIQLGGLYFGNQGIALGASAAIFGLLALCVLWAPANEFTVFTGRRVIDLPIVLFGFFFIGKEVLFLYLREFRMSSELLHVVGFFIGFPLGAIMVKNNWVDCEGWDLFTYMGLGGSKKSKKKKKKGQAAKLAATNGNSYEDQPYFQALKSEKSLKSQANRKLDEVAKMIASARFDEALEFFQAAENEVIDLEWRQEDLYRLIQGLLAEKQIDKALPLVEYHANNFEVSKPEMQLLLARLYIVRNEFNLASQTILKIDASSLNEKQSALLEKMKIKLNSPS